MFLTYRGCKVLVHTRWIVGRAKCLEKLWCLGASYAPQEEHDPYARTTWAEVQRTSLSGRKWVDQAPTRPVGLVDMAPG